MYALWANFFDNPILVRELRRRMRGKALLYSIISYLFIMTLATVLVMLSYSPSYLDRPSMDSLQQMKRTGEVIFAAITAIQALLVIIIAPTITAGLTTGEKERQTFDFLRVTTISRWMYIVGCFLSTLFYVGLALLCALPLQAVTFLYGGVSLQDVLGTFLFLLVGSGLLSAFGLFISSVTDKTRTAQGIVICIVFFLIGGGIILARSYSEMYVGATSMLPPGTSAVYIASLGIPFWMLAPLALGMGGFLFLLLAARKLFESDEARPLNHWQFMVVFLGMLGLLIGLPAANDFANDMVEWALLTLGYLLLLAAVMIFAVGRMEVGDEMWHLKRVFPFLRPIDQTLPYLALVIALWWWALGMLPSVATGLRLSPVTIEAFRTTTTTSFIALVMVGRFLTAFLPSSAKAFRALLSVLIGLVILLPIATGAARFILGDLALLDTLEALSPLGLLNRIVFTNADPTRFVFPAMMAGICFLVAAAVIGLIGEARRFQRWRGFDYHYDMPAR